MKHPALLSVFLILVILVTTYYPNTQSFEIFPELDNSLDKSGYSWIWEELQDPNLPRNVIGDDSVVWGNSLGPFFNSSETIQKLKSATLVFPELLSYFEYGQSYQGKPLAGVRITAPSTDFDRKYETVLIGEHHAREAITVIDALLFMDHLIHDYFNNEPWARSLLRNAEVYIIPAFNPDGLDFTSIYPWQRKNMQEFDADNDAMDDEYEVKDINGDGYVDWYILPDFINGTNYYWEGEDLDGDGFVGEDLPGGIDLNRNYGFKFGIDDFGSSPEENDELYRGPNAFSAPETQSFKDFAEKHHFYTSLSLHSGIEAIIYPWGYTPNPAPDRDIFLNILAELQSRSYFPDWEDTGVGYDANGEFGDWMYGALDSIAFTIETYGNWSAYVNEDGKYRGIWDYFNPPANQIYTVSKNGVQQHVPYFLSSPLYNVIPQKVSLTQLEVVFESNQVVVDWTASSDDPLVFASIEIWNQSSFSWDIKTMKENISDTTQGELRYNFNSVPIEDVRFYIGSKSQGWSHYFTENHTLTSDDLKIITSFTTGTDPTQTDTTNPSQTTSSQAISARSSSSGSDVPFHISSFLLIPILFSVLYRRRFGRD
ncbi:MAG: M14 family zinc carboxypeptidase [Candidatus Kariarchaeaceae archaeon]